MNGKIKISLSSPAGNAFSIMGQASKTGKELEMSTEQVNDIITDMRSSDYENLLSVFERHFGEYFEFVD